MATDILIIVDCQQPVDSNGNLTPDAVRMYAADPSIVRGNSQGTTELWVQVPSETNLNWRAVPLQLSQGLPEGQRWHVVITQVKLWGANSSKQLNASQFLQQWFAAAGAASGPSYAAATESFTFTPPSPAVGGSTSSNTADVVSQPISDPYVQATCTGFMEDVSNYAAYSFTCTIYKGGTKYATVSWDPYVTVTQPMRK